MQRWEYKVVSLRDQQYTAALNEFGRDGWELVNVVSEPLAATTAEAGRGFPLPRALGRIEEAADKLTKLGASDAAADAAPAATSRLLWVFRRPAE
jgi:Domain of unknown function (DUF4177)